MNNIVIFLGFEKQMGLFLWKYLKNMKIWQIVN
jgi:hypothetical protein